jgi:hypothetical protein
MRLKNVKNPPLPKLSSIINFSSFVECKIAKFRHSGNGAIALLAWRKNHLIIHTSAQWCPERVSGRFVRSFVIISNVCVPRASISFIILNKNVEKLPRVLSRFFLLTPYRFCYFMFFHTLKMQFSFHHFPSTLVTVFEMHLCVFSIEANICEVRKREK